MGLIVRKKNMKMTIPAIIALGVMYFTIYLGAKFPALQLSFAGGGISPILIWSAFLLVYCYIASILPVQTLLQPRDYINANQLLVILALLFTGVLMARPEIVAPAVNIKPEGAPPILPFIFITIACGAISGFHALVSSGVSSKQMSNEKHAQSVGYGGMLLEGYLAILVLIAVSAGIGIITKNPETKMLDGAAIWNNHYASWDMANSLGKKVGAFVEGGAKLMSSFHLPKEFGVALLGVFVASFAGTTLDSATRLQRYVLSEFGEAINVKPLSNRFIATGVAVGSAVILAMWDIYGADGWNLKGCGKGGLVLWPLFGAVNQLLGGLSLMVITVWLARKRKPVWVTAIPMIFMVIMTGWAMIHNLNSFYASPDKMHLFWIGIAVFALEIWMILETILVLRNSMKQKDSDSAT